MTATLSGRSMYIGSEHLRVVAGPGAPVGVHDLVWHEFFESRGRGIDWATHIPWSGNNGAFYTTIVHTGGDGSHGGSDQTVAALLVRRFQDTALAMVGYVCVDPRYRGHGLSRAMIDAAADMLAANGFDQMVLWTGKPELYESGGFATWRRDRRVTLAAPPENGVDHIAAALRIEPWPDAEADAGLPPFALSGWRLTFDSTLVLFADTDAGADILHVRGDPAAAVRMMAAVRPGNRTATLAPEGAFFDYLAANGHVAQVAPGPFTMFRSLDGRDIRPVDVPAAFRI